MDGMVTPEKPVLVQEHRRDARLGENEAAAAAFPQLFGPWDMVAHISIPGFHVPGRLFLV